MPYCGAAPSPAEWLGRWNLDPWLLLALALLAVAWHAKVGRLQPRFRAPFMGGMAMLVLLFVSPLCALTSALFAARTAHHALLIAVAAPLLAWAVPEREVWRRTPLAGWTVLHAAILWAWHYPPWYAAALSSDAIYWLMQASLLGSAIGFWACVRQASVAAAVAALLATMMQMGLLGALVTFASVPLYAPHFLTTAAWGLSPLEDQQLAGLIMWVPAAALYLVAALLVANRWLREEDRIAA
jgi:putative membrane protein